MKQKQLFITMLLFIAATIGARAQEVYAMNGTGVVWKNSTKLFDHGGVTRDMCVNKQNGDVYTAGWEGSAGKIWKNGEVLYTLNEEVWGIVMHNGDIYACGHKDNGDRVYGVIWKNGTELYTLYGTHKHLRIYDIKVTASGDVYTCGDDGYQAIVWKNDDRYYKQDNDHSRNFGLFMDGNDAYSAGYKGRFTTTTGGAGPYVSSVYGDIGGWTKSRVWKNGKALHTLTDGFDMSFATDVIVVNGDVYVTGVSYDAPIVWKNGKQWYRLSSSANYRYDSMPHSITSYKNDIYVGGNIDSKAKVWKNGLIYRDYGNGTIHKVVTVDDNTAPTLPSDAVIKTSEVTGQSVKLTWNAASDNITERSKLRYDISYSTTPTFNATYNAVTTSYNVTHLQPNTLYYFRVRVRDEAGNEVSYPTISARTGRGEYDAPVIENPNINLVSVSGTNISISWQKAHDGAGTPANQLKYYVFSNVQGIPINEENTDLSTQGTIGTDANSYTLTGVNINLEYTICVAVEDQWGNRSFYGNLVVKSSLDTTPPTINNKTVTTSNITDKSVTLTWNAASDGAGGTPQDKLLYNIEMWKNSEPNKKYWIHDIRFSSATYTHTVDKLDRFTNFEASTSYTFRVRVYDQMRHVSYYNDAVVTTKESMLPTITNDKLTINEVTQTSISFSWTAAQDNHTPANRMKYIVSCSQAGSDLLLKEDIVTGVTSYTIDGLRAGRNFWIRIYALNEAGNMAAYDLLVASTLIDREKPWVSDSNIGTSSVTETSINLVWEAATDNLTAPEDIRYMMTFWNSTNLNLPQNLIEEVDEYGICEYTITGLQPNTGYVVILTAFDESVGFLQYTSRVVYTATGSVPVSGFSLNRSTLTLQTGMSEDLIASFTPANAANKFIVWTSSNDAIVEADDNTVVGVSAGKATITGTTVDGGFTFNCEVTVQDEPVSRDTIFTATTTRLENYDINYVGWDGEGVIEINGVVMENGEFTQRIPIIDGTITAVARGEVELTGLMIPHASSLELIKCSKLKELWMGGDGSVTKLDVSMCPEMTSLLCAYHNISELNLKGINLTLLSNIGDQTVEVLVPYGATRFANPILYTNTTVVERIRIGSSLFAKGDMITIPAGDADIAFTTDTKLGIDISPTSYGGKFIIKRYRPAVDVTLNPSQITIGAGKSAGLTATVSPADALNDVTWKSSNDLVVTVDNDGVITGVSEGTAVITVTTVSGDFTATCNVTVVAATDIESFSIDNVLIYSYSGDIVISNVQSGTPVQIYNISGMKVTSFISNGNEMRASLPSGLYIVRVGEKVAKIRN